MADSFSLKFYLNKNKSRGKDEYKIYGRLIIDRRKSEFATNYYINENGWDVAKGRAKKNMAINDELTEAESEVNRIRRKLLDDGKPVSAKIIIQILKGDRKEKRFLLEYMAEHIEDMRKKGENAENTCDHYQSSYNIYEQFINNIYKNKDYPFNQINLEFIEQYDMYMLTMYRDPNGKKVKRNTINKHHSRLRTMLHKAVREEIISKNPYIHFPLKNTPTTRSFLTEEEINAIRKIDFSNNKTLDQVRDFFLFSCFTSLRYTDAYNLTTNNIIKTDKGKTALYVEESDKTKAPLHIPIISQTQEIIDKYNTHPDREVGGFILPRYSNQKVNDYLKNIAVLANIKKELTHHVARHTFATIALNKGIPLPVVQKILAHKSIRTTQIYAKMLVSTVEKEMEKFDL
ncbi:site-specific integrase [Carboxylicivirga linearis]|uniref:Site-specific integrase n=1 Tax=Carboxylicivirga linearis TaxID=1628157 RepID=A0ABS5JW66_9BACT|nr:site-specific integrase [Carboxylicivirga linearis]MBS2099127.1 site-specific integrase [Carboxylicivirga linearis]